MRHPLLSAFSLGLVLVLGGCRASLPPLPAWQSSEGRSHAELGHIVDLASGQLISPEQLVQHLSAAPGCWSARNTTTPTITRCSYGCCAPCKANARRAACCWKCCSPSSNRCWTSSRGNLGRQTCPRPLARQDGWDWQLYGPIVTEALQQRVPLLAANLSPGEMRQAYRQPPSLPGERSNAPTVKAALLEQVRVGHCGMLPESQLPAMLAVQQQRDRRMAERLLAAPQPALLLAGAYHVRKDWGAVALADLQAQGESKVLLLAEVGEQVDTGEADYVWYTAAMPEQDYCAQLR